MSKAKARCMTYFRSLNSHLQVLSKEDLKGTRIEHGFKRAFMSLFVQDADTFTSTMLLNVDHLQKQLDKAEFQEDGSMTAFWGVFDQFQQFIDSQVTLDYDSQMTEKYFVEYTGIEKIYKPTNNNLQTSSNTSRANQDNSPRINRSAGEEIDQNNDDNDFAKERELLASLIEKLKCEIDESKNRNKFLETSNKVLIENLKGEIKDFKNKNKSLASSNNFFKEANNRLSETNNLLYADYKKSEAELAKRLETELSKSKMMSRSFESVQKHAINLELKLQQCQEKIKNDKFFKVNRTKDFCKEREQYFEIQDLKAQLQDKGIIISELKKLIEKLKGKYVDTKFEKSSVIRQPNAFKSQRTSVLGKPTTFSNSFVRKDLSKSKSVTQNNVSNDFSKPVTAQTLPPNKKSILKNTNVLAPGMYKLNTGYNQSRTSQLPQDSRKTNKRMSFYIGVIPTTSVSRPHLKSNPMGDRVMRNNSQGVGMLSCLRIKRL
nr:hypothetical protein [Tanacetum cinerariifolium]